MSGNLVEVRSEVKSARAAKLARQLEAWAHEFLLALKLREVAVSIVVVGDARMTALNTQWRDKEKTTDVLSFPAGEPVGPGPRLLGDVAICLPTAVRQAKALGTSVDDEARLYLAHGLLHLLGHDHQTKADERRMSLLERKLLTRAGMLAR